MEETSAGHLCLYILQLQGRVVDARKKHISRLLDSPESDLIMLPLEALNGITLPPNIGLDLSTKLIWNTTARAPHGPGVETLGSEQYIK